MYLKKWMCRAGVIFASLLLIGCLPGTGGGQTPEIVLPSPTSPLLLTPESGVAVITADGATIRAEPRLSSQSLGQLQRGTPVTILASIEEPGWRLVRIDLPGAGTVDAWIIEDFLDFNPPTSTVPPTETATTAATATTAPDLPDTPTATNTPGLPDTPTPTNTPGLPDTPTPTNTPGLPKTPTPTNTPGIEPSETPTPTPTVKVGGPLTFDVMVSWAIDPNNNKEAIATVTLTAAGGSGVYRYFRDGIEQPGPVFKYRWKTCAGNPVSFAVESSDGQSVKVDRFEIPPCPFTPTPKP